MTSFERGPGTVEGTHLLNQAVQGDGVAFDRLDSQEFRDVIWGDFQYTHIMAQALSLLKREDEALRFLERTFERGGINYPFISKVDPLLEPVRPTPQFDDLMRRMKTRWEGFESEVARDV